MPNDAALFRMPEGLSEEIQDLIKHLQSTGTGIAKLKDLAAIGKRTKNNSEEFLAVAKARMQPVTWGKIEKYVLSKIEERDSMGVEALPAPPAPQVDSGEMVNPAKDLNAKDAIEKIKAGGFSKSELENIILTDDRDSVSKAANKQLDS